MAINRAQRLSGLNPLAYIGVEPLSPPQFVAYAFPPTVNDWQNFNLGCLWLNTATVNRTIPTADVWILASLFNNQATWVPFSGGGFADQFVTGTTTTPSVIGGTAVPLGGIIDIFGAHNISTSGGLANAGAVNNVVAWLNNSIILGDLADLTPFGNAVTAQTGRLQTINGNIHIQCTYLLPLYVNLFLY